MAVAAASVRLILFLLGHVLTLARACVTTTQDHSTCGSGYTKPSWMVSNLEVECQDNLDFGRRVGKLCRNVNFNVGKVIIVVHGSGSGRNDMWSGNGGWGNLFLKRGYMVFSIDYDTSGCETDIADASAFLQNQTNMPNANFAIDASNIGVVGFSFGGICVTRSAIWKNGAQQAVVALSGSVANGPLKSLHNNMPPVMLLWGDDDCTMDVSRGDNMYVAMKKKSLDVEYHVFPKDGMRNAHTQVYKTYPCSQEWAADFMDRKLGNTIAAPTAPPTVPPPTLAPTEAVEQPIGTWALVHTDARCRNSENAVDKDFLNDCWALAESRGATFVSYKKQSGDCKLTFDSKCTAKDIGKWNIWELSMPTTTTTTAEPTASPSFAPTEGPTWAPSDGPTPTTPAPTPAPTPAATPAVEPQWVLVQTAARCAGTEAFNVEDKAACQDAAMVASFAYCSYRVYDKLCTIASECTISGKKWWNTYMMMAEAPSQTEAPTAQLTPAPTPGFLAQWVLTQDAARCAGSTAFVVADETACQAAATAAGVVYYSYRHYDFKCVIVGECTILEKDYWKTYAFAR